MKTKMVKIFEDYEPIECRAVDNSNGDIMSVGEFVDRCISGGFTDYDGYAHFIVAKREDNTFVDYELPFYYEIESDTVLFLMKNENGEMEQTDIGSLVYVCSVINSRKIIWYNK